MTRNLKALGLALVAVFAMTAVLASAAQAQIKVTTGASPAWLTGEQVAGEPHTFSIENGGPVLSCTTAKFDATVKNADETVTVVPTYSGCSAKIGAETLGATVTMNDCYYFFHGGSQVTSTTFNKVDVDIKCPVGKVIEVHIYKNPAHTEELCTLTIAEQLNLTENEFHNEGSGTNDVRLTTEVTVAITRHGSLLCGKASNSAIYKGNTTIKAFEDVAGSVSNGTVSGLVEGGTQVSLTVSK